MTNNNLNDLDSLLKNRAVPEPSSNLSNRIIAASYTEKPASLLNVFLQKAIEITSLPKPVMAFASIVIVGLFVAIPMMKTDNENKDIQVTQEYFASVMSDDFIFEAFDINLL